jgi:hypothetical protein
LLQANTTLFFVVVVVVVVVVRILAHAGTTVIAINFLWKFRQTAQNFLMEVTKDGERVIVVTCCR